MQFHFRKIILGVDFMFQSLHPAYLLLFTDYSKRRCLLISHVNLLFYKYYTDYCGHIGSCRISLDHRFLAYTVDTSRIELFSIDLSMSSLVQIRE
jgi:hypothetical protein